MINTITHLIETQTQDFVYPDYQRFPYWFSRALNFDPLEIWLANTWAWSHDNARDSHQKRPWQGSWMVVNCYPDVLKRREREALKALNPDDFFDPFDDIPF